MFEIGEYETTEVLDKISGLGKIQIEPVGRWFEAFGLRRLHKQTLSTHSLGSSSSEESEADISDEDGDDEEYLLSLDPKNWKEQDHYKVLGLSKLHYRATDVQIKRAYKNKVLKHHPDKRKARGLPVKEGDDDYFTCITRAYETLGHPMKRISYDSIDPTFDDEVPQVCQNNKDNFYKVFAPIIEKNSRWSTKQGVPLLGNANSTFEEVNNFYSFWYAFDSWREYSYLDEEEKEKGENREERRWIEKQNKASRQRRKKEEIARIRSLVDNAYACDPRIQRFKEEEKEKKLAQKRAKQEAARMKAEEEDRKKREVEEEERKRKEKENEEAKAQAAAVKKEKEAVKKALKKERKTLRATLKDYEFFASDDADKVTNMQEVEKLAELLSLASLKELNEDLTSGNKDVAKESFEKSVLALNQRMAQEKQEQLEQLQKLSSGSSGGGGGGGRVWSEEELQTLIKAVNLFPAGTNQRWETVANFINHQHPGLTVTAKESLTKAKDLQKMDPSLKKEVNQKAYSKFEQAKKAQSVEIKSVESERFISVAEQQVAETGTNPAPWTADEQRLLEQALKSYGPNTEERWEKIAECLPVRSKKDCMKRYKELVELVRAKKAAQLAAAKKK